MVEFMYNGRVCENDTNGRIYFSSHDHSNELATVNK